MNTTKYVKHIYKMLDDLRSKNLAPFSMTANQKTMWGILVEIGMPLASTRAYGLDLVVSESMEPGEVLVSIHTDDMDKATKSLGLDPAEYPPGTPINGYMVRVWEESIKP